MNTISATFSLIVATPLTFITWLFGGFDLPLKILLIFIVIDLITGLIKGTYNKDLSSRVMAKGLIRKAYEFLIIVLAVQLDYLTGNEGMFRSLACYFYIATEGLSILENTGSFVELPEWLNKYLASLKEKSSKGDKEELSKGDNNGN